MRAIDVLAVGHLLCIVGCGKPAPPRAGEPAVAGAERAAGSAAYADAGPAAVAMPEAAPSPLTAKPTAFHPDDEPVCADLTTLRSAMQAWRVAASPQPHRRQARALWPTLPPACRGGTFFLAAAEIASLAGDDPPSTADRAVTVRSPADALAQGLAAEPDHPRLLAHLALIADIAPALHAPPPPADACARATSRGGAWADYAAYVCALTAIHAGDGATALAEIERVRDVALFPDLKARRAQALALSGKRKAARSLAKTAAATLDEWPFDVPETAVAAMKKKLAAL